VFAADGKTLASSRAGVIRLWDVATGQPLRTGAGHEAPVTTVAFSPDGKRLASGSWDDYTIRVWETATARPRHVLSGHRSYIRSVLFSPDGHTIISGGGDNTVRLWSAATGRELRRLTLDPDADPARNRPGRQVLGIGLSGDGKRVFARSAGFSLGGPYHVQGWEADTGKLLFHRQEGRAGHEAAFSPDGSLLVSETGLVQDTVTGGQLYALRGPIRVFWAMTFSPDGQTLAMADIDRSSPQTDGQGPLTSAIDLWEMATGKKALSFAVPGRIHSLAFSPGGRCLVCGGADGIRLWNVATGKRLLRCGSAFCVRSVAFAPDGRAVATGLHDSTTLLWPIAKPVGRAGLPARRLGTDALDRLWTDLAREDAAGAHVALGTLAAAPAQTVPFLKARLRPVEALHADWVRQQIRALDSRRFRDRRQAREKLALVAELAEPALRQALEGHPSPEVRQGAEALLREAARVSRGVVGPGGDLRTLRAVRLLETIGNRQAEQVLSILAGGAPSARLTRQAEAARKRLRDSGAMAK
jgi:WD40 repeat protein